MNLDIDKDVLDYITALDAKQYKQVARKIFALTLDALPPDSSLLQGYDNVRRADIGEFRVIYRIREDAVKIMMVGRRNDDAVYRALARKMR